MAPMRPSSNARAAYATGAGASTGNARASSTRKEGPQRGQQVGWAWNRRSRGSSYSRRPPPQLADESIERVRSALYLDDHSARAVSYEARESQVRGERVHVRAKAHTLHHASDGDAPARR